ncbi:MAG TPA: pilin [Candidatus Paceibacterota bacterium]|jgi:hypothetical protein|nr:pilin [Candidatus Paceibacterota bacterium]
MKYFLSTIALLSVLLSGSIAHAQVRADCSAVNSDKTYEQCCTGQAPEDSQTCNNYAQSWTDAHNADNPQCYSIGSNNEDQCCPNGESDSPICYAYDNFTNRDAALSQISGQINSQTFSGGTQNTGAVNNSYDASYVGNPAVSSAQTDQQALNTCEAIKFTNLLNLAIWVKCLIGVIVIPGIFTLAFAVFLWGVFKFIRASEQKDKAESKQFIYMGLIGLFVMVSVWGILRILNTTLGINSTVPTLQTDYLDTSNVKK